MSKDQFKIADPAFDIKRKTLYSDAVTNATRLVIPTGVMTSWLGEDTAWVESWEIAQVKNSATPVDHLNKNTAKDKLTLMLRRVAKQYYYDNPAATAEDIANAGLVSRSLARGKGIVADTEIPNTTCKPVEGHFFNFMCKDSMGKKGKPKGIVFYRVRYFLGINPPADPGLFPLFKDFNKYPIKLGFTLAQAGQPITMAACYVTKDGTEGSYGFVFSTVIP